MKSLMYSSSRGRAGLFPFQPLPSLPHFPVHEEARKEPLNESLENQHYDAPCAQQRPTSFKRSAPEKPLRAVFVHDRLEGRAQPASQRCICGMSKKRDNTSVQSICAKLALVLKDA